MMSMKIGPSTSFKKVCLKLIIFVILSSFEIEFRESCTIKRDTNVILDVD